MSKERPQSQDLTGDETAGVFALSVVVGGALWWFGHSGVDIAAAVGSTIMLAEGATLDSSIRSVSRSAQLRATGRHMAAFGIGSAIGYFGISDTALGYFAGGVIAFSLAAAPEVFPQLFSRSK